MSESIPYDVLKGANSSKTHVAKEVYNHSKFSKITLAHCGFKAVTQLNGNPINTQAFREPITCKRCRKVAETPKVKSPKSKKIVKKKELINAPA
jgi:hypothetical protein